MSKQIVPRTAVRPDGGIFRVAPPAETDAGEWLKNNQHIARFLRIDEVRDTFPTTWEGIGKLIVAVSVEEAQQRLSEMVAENLESNTLETLGEMKELAGKYGHLKIKIAVPNFSLYPLSIPRKEIVAQHVWPMTQTEEPRRRTQPTLQFMWDAMPLEMKQEIVQQYHPHNCVKKDD